MARKGLLVDGIDVLSNHAQWSQEEIRAQVFEKAITVQLMGYHHLEAFDDAWLW